MSPSRPTKELCMKQTVAGMLSLTATVLLFASCVSTVPPRQAEDDVIYLNLVWHQHQPQYYPDPETGIITRPWVRMHAQKDYYDMAALLAEYPQVRATFNLTPVLLRQIDQFLQGAKDIYWVLAEKPAEQLTDEEKRFILTRFFDANWDNIVKRFPRYRELLAKRGDGSSESIDTAIESYTEQDFRDLQIWFNLAWFDPSFLSQDPLAALVAQDRDFSEDQKQIVFEEALRVISQVVEIHRELQDKGQIEVTTTPYAHPILPLLYNTDLVEANDPTAEVPPRFSYPNDAIAHLQKSVEQYTESFGRRPRGLWPAEGSVAQEVVRIIANAGFTWMASGEQVLARSLGIDGFTRDAQGTVREADDLYRPYYVTDKDGQQVAIVFRDLRISDLIGFEYSGTPPQQAVADFIGRIERIEARLAEQGAEGPHLVSIILDGENAWEHYPNDGIEFLSGLYETLSSHPTIRTITPSEYLALFPEQRNIEDLWPGSWFSPDFGTWIGEPEETLAWTYLERVRRHLAKYDIQQREEATEAELAAALDFMYLAEGSDWFWWYGSDQDSGVDEYFDEGFRALLRGVYTSLGDDVPAFVDVPIIPERPVQPERAPRGPIEPTIDGVATEAEWDDAGYYQVRGGAMARAEEQISALYYGFNADSFLFRIDGRTNWDSFADGAVTVHFSLPGQEFNSPVSLSGTVLGFRAGFAASIDYRSGAASLSAVNRFGEWADPSPLSTASVSKRTIEISIPIEALTDVQPGDAMNAKALLSDASGDRAVVPALGPVRAVIPDLGNTEPILTVIDAVGDDNGPGTYAYPTDAVFVPGSYDITEFAVAQNDRNLVFTFTVNAPIGNPWGSPVGLSIQTFDVYIDTDGAAGADHLLEGRNASLNSGGWDLAVWVEGWNQKLLVPNAQGDPVETAGNPVRVVVDAANATVSILVPKTALADALGVGQPDLAPEAWRYTAAVLSQEGYPSAGVRRVRDVQESATQWRIGGATDPDTATRILDLVLPAEGQMSQNEALSGAGVPLLEAR